MELGTAQGKSGATTEGSGRLRKDKTVKIRMDPAEIHSLDELSRRWGYAERATTLRELMKMAGELEQARRIVAAYRRLQDAKAAFAASQEALP